MNTGDRYLRRLAGEIALLRGQVRDLNRGVGLGHSSFSTGGITQYGPDESTVRSRYGDQYDGTTGIVTFNGPRPPTPSWTNEFGDPVEAIVGGLRVRWEGAWEAPPASPGLEPTPEVAPLDFQLVEVHVSPNPDMSGLMFDTLRGVMVSARGGEQLIWLPVLETGGYYIRLVARTNTGAASTASPVLGPFNPLKIREEDLGFEIGDLGGNTISRGPDAPENPAYGDLWLMTPGNIAKRWEPPGEWVDSRDQGIVEAINDAIDAMDAASDASALASTKAAVFRQPSAPTAAGRAVGDIWFDSDDNDLSYTWALISGTTYGWQKRLISNSSIKPYSLIAKDVVAVGTITAPLLEAILVLATVIIAGNPNGEHTKIDSTGVAVYIDDPIDGVPNEVTRLGRQTGGINPATGRQSWNITEQGRGFLQGLSVTEEPIFQGQPLSALVGQGMKMVAFGQINFPAYPGIGTGELGIMEIVYPFREGRAYAIQMVGLNVAGNVSGDDVVLRLRLSDGSTAPQVAHQLWGGPYYDQIIAAGRYRHYGFFDFVAQPSFSGNYRLLVTLARGAGGTGSLEVVACQPRIIIYDIGANVAPTGVLNYGGAPAPGTAGPPPVQRFDDWMEANWSATYNGSGGGDSGPEMIQGYTSYYPARGNARSMMGFPDVTARLAGVPDERIERIELSLYANHWNYNSGGTASLGYHSNAGQPGTFVNTSTNQFEWSNWGRQQRVTIDVTNLSGLKAAMRTGGVRGFTLGPGPGGSTDPIYYGRFNGAGMAEPPRLHIVYYK